MKLSCFNGVLSPGDRRIFLGVKDEDAFCGVSAAMTCIFRGVLEAIAACNRATGGDLKDCNEVDGVTSLKRGALLAGLGVDSEWLCSDLMGLWLQVVSAVAVVGHVRPSERSTSMEMDSSN
jgi:hypothetical protein